MEISTRKLQQFLLKRVYNIFLFEKRKMNFPNNLTFSGFNLPQSSLFTFNNFNLRNYQHLSYPQSLWFDENYLLSTFSRFNPYQIQHHATSEAMLAQPYFYSKYQNSRQIKVQKFPGHINQIPLQPIQVKYLENSFNQTKKIQETLQVYNGQQENQNLNQFTLQKHSNDENKSKDLPQSIQGLQDKKLIQNLRYQRKNIQANIVNKIYTYLKTFLKFGEGSALIQLKTKEKALIYYKVLEKLEKAKKQNIKRQFLKGLISMHSSLPGYNKIAKELAKKGQSIEQFEYNIRVIIRNYLRLEAIGSILTSKKMNPHLWKDHIEKIREIQEYLFSINQNQRKL